MEFHSVLEKMNKDKFLVVITNLNQIEICKKARITNFLFPLKDFCVGFPKTFELSEIEEGYLYINRILDDSAYQKLKETLKTIPEKIKGIVFEDFGVITLAKELGIKQKLILFQTHFATNSKSINENLEFVDSIVLGTDITEEEIKTILEKTKKPLVYFLYGFVPGMYSRRTLLTNFEKEFDAPKKDIVNLKEQVTKKEFLAVENEYGTVLYYGKYLNAFAAIPDEKILYYFINPLFLNEQELEIILADFIKGKCPELEEKEDQGFLHTKTIYRLKEGKNE